MPDPPAQTAQPLLLKLLTPGAVAAHLARDPRLIVPVGTAEQHGAHLPLGCDTLIVERLADDLSATFQVLRAPTIEYGVNAPTAAAHPGVASVRRKTLHRFLNDLIGSWEEGGVEQFILLTAHGHDPHQEALSTLHPRRASVRTVDIFAVPLPGQEWDDAPIHGGEIDTSLLLYIDGACVDLTRGHPSRASAAKGEALYRFICERVAGRAFGATPARADAPR